jgi:hypothetical protein
VRKRATSSDSNAEKWSIIVQFAVFAGLGTAKLLYGCGLHEQ